MVKLLASQGGCKGVSQQSLMSTAMRLPINSAQRTGFCFLELELPVDCRQHLTQQPVR